MNKRKSKSKDKKLLPLLILTIVIILLGVIGIPFLLILDSDEYVQVAEEKEVEKKVMTAPTVEDTLEGFLKVIFTYNSSERPFYEGAEPYMTETAYQSMVPLFDESEELEFQPVTMISELQEFNCYYNQIDDRNIGAMAEVWFKLNGTGEFRIRNIIRVKLRFSNTDQRWLISEIETISSYEE